MIPMLLIFKLDAIQITFLCVFFNICAACTTDLLFDYKVGELCNIDFKKIKPYEYNKYKEIINIGRKSVKSKIFEIKKLLLGGKYGKKR